MGSYLNATSSQAMATYLWQRKVGEELERVRANNFFSVSFFFEMCVVLV